MKRFFFAVLILIACFATAISGSVILQKSCEKITDELEKASVSILNGEDETGVVLSKIEESWKKERLKFSVFLDHSTVDTLDESLLTISEMYSLGEEQTVFETIRESIAVLNDIVEEQRITLGNIL